MIDYKKIFIDTAPFIYFIEKNTDNPQYFDKMKHFFKECYESEIALYTSVITMEEYFVFPYRQNEGKYIDAFEKLLVSLDIRVSKIDKPIAKKAARIRADYKSFKAMDALQLSTACISGCDLFLTNDKQLKQFKEITCITVDEI